MSAGVMAPLPHLFSPLTLRGVTLRNRIVKTAHNTGLSDDNRIGNRLIAYYEARARGGVGLIITGSTSVHPSSSSRLIPAVSNWDDLIIEQYRGLAATVHGHGAAVIAQLNHAGAQSGISDGVRQLLAPSPFDSELGIETPHALDLDTIGELSMPSPLRLRALDRAGWTASKFMRDMGISFSNSCRHSPIGARIIMVGRRRLGCGSGVR
jgi:2,4-dienoyl-CoA reductase-like NADH-dependent reductase (Old Yellow Enzyme family)